MRIAVFLTSLAAFLSITIGAYVIVRDSKATANKIFALYSAVNFLWYLSTFFQLSAPDATQAKEIFNLGLFPSFVSLPLFAHFNLALMNNTFVREHRWFVFLLYIPGLFFIIMQAAAQVFPVIMIPTALGWSYAQDLSSVWTSLGFLQLAVYILPICFLLARWGKRSGNPENRTQARIINSTVLIGISLYCVAVSLGHVPGLEEVGAIAHLLTLVWLLGVGYAVGRHRLMGISPAEAAYSIYTTMADGVLLVDRAGVIVNVNPAGREILKMSPSQLLRHPIDETLPGVFTLHDAAAVPSAGETIRDSETVLNANSGQEMYISYSASAVKSKSGEANGTVLVFRDISERKQTERRLQHMATHDVLTNLPNRVLLNDRLRNAISHAERHKFIIAVLLIDLDKFKQVNDTYGHDTGDRLLIEVARRLTVSVREYDTVSRLGGDEFVVVLTDLKEQRDCDTVITRIRTAFSSTMNFDQHLFMQTLSIGVSLFPQHADNIEDLYKFADVALYKAKAAGRNDIQFYARESDAAFERKASIEHSLGSALKLEEFELYYQPIFEISTRKLVAMESLIRWNHPRFGVIGPIEFIPMAERTGLIVSLGEWVIRQACKQIAEWQKMDGAVPITVNLSAKQFQDPQLVDKVSAAVAEFKVESRLLQFEVTESTAIVEMERAVETSQKFKNMGIGLIIDDFGSGYSSMTWLKYLEARAVKIDRFFIENLTRDSADAAIVKAIVSLAHSLGMTVIAEGIETEEQLEALHTMHWENSTDFTCDLGQGYIFSRPVQALAAEAFITGERKIEG